MSALDEIQNIAKSIQNPYLRKWTGQGGKVIGYFCNDVPEELLWAAGVLPFKMRATGSQETALADAYFSNYNCSFARHCLNFAFRGDFDFLHGIIGYFGCDHLRRIYDIWKHKVDTPFKHFLKVPHTRHEDAIQFFKKEIVELKEHLEQDLGIKITDKKLKEAIKVYNEGRALIKELYEQRKEASPSITGAEALAVSVASSSLPRPEFNTLMKRVLNETKGRNINADGLLRLMFISGTVDDPEYIKLIEDVGSIVVADFTCYGVRQVGELVDESIADPIEALVERFGRTQTCPRTMGAHPQRWDFINQAIKDYKVDGIISTRLTFCELWAGENYMVRMETKEEDIPMLILEKEYKLESVGQLKNRIQAFLEILEEVA